MSEPGGIGRRIFRVFAAGFLTLFAGFVVTVTICAATVHLIREGRAPRGQRANLEREGFRLDSITFGAPNFSADDAHVIFERHENYHKREVEPLTASMVVPTEYRTIPHPERVPTGRRSSRPAPKVDLGQDEEAIRQLLHIFGVTEGRWLPLTTGALPAPLERLNSIDRSTPALEDHLAHPDPLLWMDAAIESILRDGARARPLADRIVRTYRLRGPHVDGLVNLILKLRTVDALAECSRIAVEVNEDGLLQLHLLEELSGRTGEARGRDAARVLAALARHEWASRDISIYLKGWLVRALEEGGFDDLGADDRARVWELMRVYVDVSFLDRLARVLDHREGCSGAAAYLLLCRIAGTPLDVPPTPDLVSQGRKWWRKNETKVREKLGH